MDIASLVEIKRNPKIPDLAPGDTVKVSARIVEGGKERIQVFQGVVIKVRRGSTGASFTVRHVAYGIGVERTFLLYSPLVEKVEIVRHGKVRRAKLYYLRGLSGKAARRKIKRVDWKAKKVEEEVLEPEPEEIVEPLLEMEEEAVLEAEPAPEEAPEPEAAEPEPESPQAEPEPDAEEPKEETREPEAEPSEPEPADEEKREETAAEEPAPEEKAPAEDKDGDKDAKP